MKKLVIFLVLLCMPGASFAMKPLDDESMGQVMGQAGVSIFVDITMNIHIGTLAWGDSDGLAPGPYNPWNIQTSGGYIGVSDMTVSGLSIAHRLADAGANSVSFWPGAGSMDVVNGIPYYVVHAGPGNP